MLGRDGEVVARHYSVADAAKTPSLQAAAATSDAAGPVASAGAPLSLGVSAQLESQPAESTSLSHLQIVDSSHRWLDAYYNGDHGAMAGVAVPGADVWDGRLWTDRLPAGLGTVRRTFDRMRFERSGDTINPASR